MSKKVSQEKYEKTRSYRMKQWFDGTRDPFLNTVEMKPQKAFSEDKETLERRAEDRKELRERIYDTAGNTEGRGFRKFYRVARVLFCICLGVMLLAAVWGFSASGNSGYPVNYEGGARLFGNGR